jgi:uncharacterized protein YcnI
MFISLILLSFLNLSVLFAHVDAIPSIGVPSSSILLSFRITHACSNSDTTTTNVTITIPETIISAKPKPLSGWTTSTQTREHNPPIVSGTKTVNTSVGSVSWSNGALLTSEIQDFSLYVNLPNATIGSSLVFKVYQQCLNSVVAWDQVAGTSQSASSLSKPAAILTIAPSDNPAEKLFQTLASDLVRYQTISIVAIAFGSVGFLFGGVSLLKLCCMPKK